MPDDALPVTRIVSWAVHWSKWVVSRSSLVLAIGKAAPKRFRFEAVAALLPTSPTPTAKKSSWIVMEK